MILDGEGVLLTSTHDLKQMLHSIGSLQSGARVSARVVVTTKMATSTRSERVARILD